MIPLLREGEALYNLERGRRVKKFIQEPNWKGNIFHLSNVEQIIQPFQIQMCIVQEIISAKEEVSPISLKI